MARATLTNRDLTAGLGFKVFGGGNHVSMIRCTSMVLLTTIFFQCHLLRLHVNAVGLDLCRISLDAHVLRCRRLCMQQCSPIVTPKPMKATTLNPGTIDQQLVEKTYLHVWQLSAPTAKLLQVSTASHQMQHKTISLRSRLICRNLVIPSPLHPPASLHRVSGSAHRVSVGF